MFMERIEIPVTEQKRPRPIALKVGVGLAFCLFALTIMPPYLAAVGIWLASPRAPA